MGNSFAPCYANLTMGWLEKSCIWRDNPFAAQIILYGRYIDDVIAIWDGPSSSIAPFVEYCNMNYICISFTHVHDPQSLVFLDLELSHAEACIVSKTYFKLSAGN